MHARGALQPGIDPVIPRRRRATSWLDRVVAASVFDAPWIDTCQLFDAYRGTLHFETARRTIHARALEVLAEAERTLAQ